MKRQKGKIEEGEIMEGRKELGGECGRNIDRIKRNREEKERKEEGDNMIRK